MKFQWCLTLWSLILTPISVLAQKELTMLIRADLGVFAGRYPGGTIEVSTDNPKENHRYGKHTARSYLEGRTASSVAEVKADLPSAKFNGRSIMIKFIGVPGSCFVAPPIEGSSAVDGATFTLSIERDEDCWEAGTVNVAGSIWVPKALFAMDVDSVGQSFLQVEFPVVEDRMDLRDSAMVVVDVDARCRLSNRRIVHSFTHLRKDVPEPLFNSLERSLLKEFGRCRPRDGWQFPIHYRPR